MARTRYAHCVAKRRPQWIYDQGEEPDYRYTLANERTFLAWFRTALALVAAGVAVDTLLEFESSWAGTASVVGLLLAGSACMIAGWWRWTRGEIAMRKDEPLPAFATSGVLTVVVAVLGVVLAVALW